MKQIKQKIIDLAVKLIEIKTNPTNFAELENSLEIVKSELTDYTIEEFESNGYKSLLIHNKSTGHRNFDLILNGHLDVIPAKFEKYQARIEDNKIYGIGSMDMKGNIASMVYAFRDIAHKTNTSVALQIVTDEEVGGFYGTKYQIDQGVRAKFVIAGEATNFDIVNKARGIVWLKLKFKGKTAHGAYPWLGLNSIHKASEAIERILKLFPIPKTQEKNVWVTSVNFSNIETNNKAFNKIPDECILSLDLRYLPEDKEGLIEKIKKKVGRMVLRL